MRKFWAFFKVYLSDCLTYRGDIFLFTLSGLALPLSTLLLWLSMDSPNSPFSRNDFILYYLATTVVGVWVSVWSSRFISQDIRSGRISPLLVKPVPFLAGQIGNNIAEKIFKTFFLLPGLVVLILLLHLPSLSLSPLSILLFIISWFMACALNFLIDMSLGLSAFWLDDNAALSEMVNILNTIFSGRMIPLLLFPIGLRSIAAILPFRYTLSLPLEVLLGKSVSFAFLPSLLIQFFWLVIAFIIYRYLWAAGTRRYSASGN